MQTIKCFEVMGHTDTNEGRGPMIVAARFSNRSAAEQYVKSKAYATWCVWGSQHKDDIKKIKEVTLTILDSAEELELANRENLKAAALAKLTAAEREALGL